MNKTTESEYLHVKTTIIQNADTHNQIHTLTYIHTLTQTRVHTLTHTNTHTHTDKNTDKNTHEGNQNTTNRNSCTIIVMNI